jgi:membrane fusion protein, copper/silver efflux system
MRVLSRSIFLVAVIVMSYVAGTWHSRDVAQGNSAPTARAVLYYHCPMHPGLKSDKPGVAPCCGMQLEPVYSDGSRPAEGASDVLPGSAYISPEKQQLSGVRVARVEKTAGNQVLRLFGRVAADENRIYPIVIGLSGRVLKLTGGATGSEVQKDQLLAVFYSRDTIQTQNSYITALNAIDGSPQAKTGRAPQIGTAPTQVTVSEEAMLTFGMSEQQISEIAKDRKAKLEIEIRSPVRGFVQARSIYPNQRFERGTEFYRIVDLSRVWIMADVYKSEAGKIHPGLSGRFTTPEDGKTYRATVANVAPQFDAASRTLKVRLEADNPGFSLRPDMFVDIELPIQVQPTLAVPSEAVLDTGLKKTVFVDHGNGIFEPRRVEIGSRLGDCVEITRGLTEGERIVVSGNFLIDSESRLNATAAEFRKISATEIAGSKPDTSPKGFDPVCGMTIDIDKSTLRSSHDGKAFYFCSDKCKRDFDSDPKKYSARPAASDRKGPELAKSQDLAQAIK